MSRSVPPDEGTRGVVSTGVIADRISDLPLAHFCKPGMIPADPEMKFKSFPKAPSRGRYLFAFHYVRTAVMTITDVAFVLL